MTQTLQRHTSILDVVLGEAKSLNRHLGRQDQRKFGEYLDSVRSLEKKIVQPDFSISRPDSFIQDEMRSPIYLSNDLS